MNLKNYLNVLFKFQKNKHNIIGDIMLFTCVQIFFARLIDVTLGTLRTILIVRGKKNSASVIAFFEVFIWFLIAKEALDNTDKSLYVPVVYSLGFAVGTYIGILLTNKYMLYYVNAQITTKRDNLALISDLRKNGFGVSVVALKNDYDNILKDLLFISVNKKNFNNLKIIVKKHDKDAFIILSDVKYVQNGLIK